MATQPNFDRTGPTDIKLVTHASGNIPPATSVFFSCADNSYVPSNGYPSIEALCLKVRVPVQVKFFE